MFNPIMSELVAREQTNDRLREAEQLRLVQAATTNLSAGRFDLRAILSRFVSSIRYHFNRPAHVE